MLQAMQVPVVMKMYCHLDHPFPFHAMLQAMQVPVVMKMYCHLDHPFPCEAQFAAVEHPVGVEHVLYLAKRGHGVGAAGIRQA
jgi:hypothetical protein